MMSRIQYKIYPYRLQFRYPFKIAVTARTGTDNVYIQAAAEGKTGWGETVFIPYYPETLTMFEKLLLDIPKDIDFERLDDVMKQWRSQFPNRNFSLAGIEIALQNLRTAFSGKPIHAWYGLEAVDKISSYTLGISHADELIQKYEDNAHEPYFKLKVSEDSFEEMIGTYRKISSKPFTIDANQGFKDRQTVLRLTYQLADWGVEYIEQPFAKDDWESHAWLKKQSPIPVIADESFQVYEDLEKVIKCFHGVNMKLMKCGGVGAGYACLKRATEMELKKIIGCMSESSVAILAAKELAALADWIDLDGPKLITNDLFDGTKVEEEIIEWLKSSG